MLQRQGEDPVLRHRSPELRLLPGPPGPRKVARIVHPHDPKGPHRDPLVPEDPHPAGPVELHGLLQPRVVLVVAQHRVGPQGVRHRRQGLRQVPKPLRRPVQQVPGGDQQVGLEPPQGLAEPGHEGPVVHHPQVQIRYLDHPYGRPRGESIGSHHIPDHPHPGRLPEPPGHRQHRDPKGQSQVPGGGHQAPQGPQRHRRHRPPEPKAPEGHQPPGQ